MKGNIRTTDWNFESETTPTRKWTRKIQPKQTNVEKLTADDQRNIQTPGHKSTFLTSSLLWPTLMVKLWWKMNEVWSEIPLSCMKWNTITYWNRWRSPQETYKWISWAQMGAILQRVWEFTHKIRNPITCKP